MSHSLFYVKFANSLNAFMNSSVHQGIKVQMKHSAMLLYLKDLQKLHVFFPVLDEQQQLVKCERPEEQGGETGQLFFSFFKAQAHEFFSGFSVKSAGL